MLTDILSMRFLLSSIQKKVTVAGWQQRGGYYEQNRQTLYGNDPLLSGGSEAYPAFCEGA